MTGIGQKSENLLDGSNYSATWSNRHIAPWAAGKSAPKDSESLPMTTGLTNCSEYPLRSVYSPGTVKSDCSNSPSKGLTGNEGDVKVTNYSVTGETDTTVLPKP